MKQYIIYESFYSGDESHETQYILEAENLHKAKHKYKKSYYDLAGRPNPFLSNDRFETQHGNMIRLKKVREINKTDYQILAKYIEVIE